MKPFDIELAKAGHPVCTRDGRKVKILCFDRKNPYFPIVALVENTSEDEELVIYPYTGIYDEPHESDEDLMLPEKKEGWVNIYKGDDKRVAIISNAYNTKEKALNKIDEVLEATYITTKKIEWEE